MLDMGFKPQVDRIVRRLPRDRQTMFFSATLDGSVNELALAYTTDPVRCEAAPIVALTTSPSSTGSSRSSRTRRSTRSSICCGARAGRRSSSSARGAAPTGSSASWRATT